jgi:hypothetical protein
MGLGKAQRQEGNQSAMLTEPLTVARNMLAFLCYPQGSTTNGHSDFLVHSPILGRDFKLHYYPNLSVRLRARRKLPQQPRRPGPSLRSFRFEAQPLVCSPVHSFRFVGEVLPKARGAA